MDPLDPRVNCTNFTETPQNNTGFGDVDPELRGFTAYDMGFLIFSFMCLVGCYSIAFLAVLQSGGEDGGSEKVKAARDDLILSHLIVREWHKEGENDDGSEPSSTDVSSQNETELTQQQQQQQPLPPSLHEVDCDESSHPVGGKSLYKLPGGSDEEMGECCTVVSEVESNIEQLDDIDNFDGCAICLAPYEAKQEVCESNNISCHHIFHKTCMVAWLKKHNQCPVCRQVYILETV